MSRPVKQLFTNVATALSFLCDTVWSLGRQLVATGKAADNLKSARMYPVAYTEWRYAESGTPLYLGNYRITSGGQGVTASLLAATSNCGETHSIQIPWQATDWRRNAPFHSVYVYLPFYGLLYIPTSEIIDDTSIMIETTLTLAGTVIFRLYGMGATAHRIGEYSATVSSDFFIGASNTTPMAMLTGGASMATSIAATAGATTVAGAVAGVAGLIGTTNAIMPISSGGGGVGGGTLPLLQEYQVITIFHDTNIDPASVSATIGTPTMAVKQIGTLSGFVQTQGASVAASCDETTRAEINALLDGGIYYE